MNDPVSKNIQWHGPTVTRDEREALLGQRGVVVWLTGLSGSGKSTIARRVEQRLLERRAHVYVLDGDNLRMGLNRDLGFSPEDRRENNRRVACVAQLFADAGTICLTAFISPYRADREQARAMVPGRFVEVYIATPIEACEDRDPKGLYKQARAGAIKEFTGISAPYEEPLAPELRVDTAGQTVDESASAILDHLLRGGFVR